MERLLAGARVALSSTFRDRAHLPGSPWFAFLAPSGGIVVDRTDNPEAPIPADWRQLCPVNNARSDDANMATIADALQRQPLPGAPRTETHCADCGAAFPPVPAGGGASGYAVTAVPRFPHARVRALMRDRTNLGTEPRTAQPGCSFFAAHYDVEGEQAAHDAQHKLPQRRICYACSAVLESETMTARGRTCLYLSKRANVDGAYFLAGDARRGYAYDYTLSNWPGNAPFRLLGRVRESHGFGFGRRYDVRTFRFVGPDGYVWTGRNAGDMQLARCRRTKERA